MKIVSRENAGVKQARRLLRDAAFRRESGLFAVEGARLCADAAASQVVIQTAFYTERAAQTYAATLQQLRAVCDRVVMVSEPLMAFMADTVRPQGLLCVCKSLDNLLAFDTIKKDGVYLALEDLQDPANVGAVVRTAEALGVDGLLLSGGCCDVYNPKVLRGSMGGVLRMPFLVCGDMAGAVIRLQERGLTAFACVADATAEAVQTAGFAGGRIAVIGNEGNGLRPETQTACKRRLTIPMKGRAQSLNAAVAAAIVLWEMLR